MKKEFSLLLLLLLILAGCSKATQVKDSVDAKIDEIAADAGKVPDAVQSTVNNTLEKLPQSPEGQTVYVPLPQQSAPIAPDGTILQAYKSSCWVEKYKVLNKYCSLKNFWHNQSTLISWYVPYGFILLLLLAAIIILWWRSHH